MANTNNTFNAQEFFEGKFYAPLTLGQHEVTFGNVRAVKEETNDGTQYYILAPMTFANGRVINNRFYNFGMQIFCNQIRKQFEDVNDYASIKKFLDTLKDKTAKVWISQRTYEAKDGSIKSSYQYDFTAPKEEEPTDEELSISLN